MNNKLQSYAFFNQLTALHFVERIILYGSRARRDNVERSDIDLAIDCPNATDIDWLTIVDIIDNADTLLKIDCIRLDTLRNDSPIKKSIEQDGIIVYRKNK